MKKIFLKTCALALSLICAALLFTACGETSGLPSLEDAQKIEVGMSYDEAKAIMGCPARCYVQSALGGYHWLLDNGQILRIGLTELQEIAIMRITSAEITEARESWPFIEQDSWLEHVKAFDSLAAYNSYAATENQKFYYPDAPEASLQLANERFVYASALGCFGDFSQYVYNPLARPYRYYYTFTDANAVKIEIEIQANRNRLFEEGASPLYIEALPSALQNMTNIGPQAKGCYYNRSGLIYRYNQDGELSKIFFVENSQYFTITTDFAHYPLDGESSIMQQLLSVDETVAGNAWQTLQTHLRTKNRKPISTQLVVGIGISVAVLTISIAALLILLKKKRTGKSAAPEALDADLESTAPAPETTDTDLESTAPAPETPQNE